MPQGMRELFYLEKEIEETEQAIFQYGDILDTLRLRRHELIAMKQELEAEESLNASLRLIYGARM
jgi:hypothetical protein